MCQKDADLDDRLQRMEPIAHGLAAVRRVHDRERHDVHHPQRDEREHNVVEGREDREKGAGRACGKPDRLHVQVMPVRGAEQMVQDANRLIGRVFPVSMQETVFCPC